MKSGEYAILVLKQCLRQLRLSECLALQKALPYNDAPLMIADLLGTATA